MSIEPVELVRVLISYWISRIGTHIRIRIPRNLLPKYPKKYIMVYLDVSTRKCIEKICWCLDSKMNLTIDTKKFEYL